MPNLSVEQYIIVYNMLSLTIASMFASFVFFVLVRNEILPKYRGAIVASALVVFIAGYHYFRIFGSWQDAYMLSGNEYVATGKPFNDAYRYVDWLLTVPLLMVELVLVLGLTKAKTQSLLFKLVIAAFLMIALGYPGEVDRESSQLVSNRGLWGLLSTIPFLYILVVLVGELRKAMKDAPNKQVGVLLRNIGLLTLFTWGFYPIAFMAPFYGLSGANAEVGLQVGYSIADITAKCGYGLLIYHIARLRSEAEDGVPNREAAVAPAAA